MEPWGREIPPEDARGGILDSCFSHNFRPETESDNDVILSGVVTEWVGMDVRSVKFADVVVLRRFNKVTTTIADSANV